MWSRIKSALRNLLHKQQVESRLDDEIRSYVNALTDEKIAGGLPPDEARRRTLAESGGMEQMKQAVRDQRASTTVESVLQDVRYGLRQMRRNPAFSWTAVITLGLGTGATTAIFSAVYALLIGPLPYPGSNRLFEISENLPKSGGYWSAQLNQDFVAAQSSLKSFRSVAGYVYEENGARWNYSGDQNLKGTGDPLRVKVARITQNFLPVLGVVPAEGRNFLSSEDRENGPPVAMLSHRLWETKFDGDAAIIGRSITIAGRAWTVVGVLPAHFVFPDPTIEPDVYIPADLSPSTNLGTTNLIVEFVQPIARLRDGVSVQQAQAELNVFNENRMKSYAPLFAQWAQGRRILAEPLRHYLTGDDRNPLLILLACVGAVLLIACANVANLQLARTVTRQHEMAVRGALGAGRMRLMRQSLVESLTLAAMAAALGLGIAVAVTWLIRRGGMPGSYTAELLQAPFGKLGAAVEVNGWVLGFAAGLTLVTTVLFGLAPALGASRTELRSALEGTARRISAGRQQRRLRSALLMAEIGLAVLLLSGAGLLIRSFVNELGNESGFDARQCLTAQIQRNRLEAPEKQSRFVQDLLPRLQALPGVSAAAAASVFPLEGCDGPALAFGDGPPLPRLERPHACEVSISNGYFRAAGTRVLEGRQFSGQDSRDSVRVVIVNQAFVREYLRGEPLARQFRVNVPHQGFVRMTIVGVAQDVRYDGLTGKVEPAIYVPFDQEPTAELDILLRTTVQPGSLSAGLRRAVLDADPDQPLFDVETMEGRIARSLAQERLTMLLTGCFAVLAMLLAGVGIYGVFAYWVNQRRQEMGIRLALGSSRAGLLRLIVMQAVWLVVAGGAMGLTGAWFLDRLLASTLVGVKVHDPVSLSFACALMIGIALLGSCVPARNAARTDLISVLRSE